MKIPRVFTLVACAALAVGCEKSSGQGTAAAPGDTQPRAAASRPDPPAPKKRHFFRKCFDPYAGCKPLVGLPALSGDGTMLAFPDRGPSSPRDEFLLTMRIIAVADGSEIAATPIVTIDDYNRGYDDDTGGFKEPVAGEIDRRIDDFERVLGNGGYRGLVALGVVHEDRESEEVRGMKAAFDGKELVVTEGETVRWRKPIDPQPRKPGPGDAGEELDCGPFPVADVRVWVSRDKRVLVARVGYISSHLCSVETRTLVWR